MEITTIEKALDEADKQANSSNQRISHEEIFSKLRETIMKSTLNKDK